MLSARPVPLRPVLAGPASDRDTTRESADRVRGLPAMSPRAVRWEKKVGQLAVYPGHGVARIVAMQEHSA